jgi:hypothetical protein
MALKKKVDLNKDNERARGYQGSAGKKAFREVGIEIDLDHLQKLYAERGCRVQITIMDDGDRPGERGAGSEYPSHPRHRREYSLHVPKKGSN